MAPKGPSARRSKIAKYGKRSGEIRSIDDVAVVYQPYLEGIGPTLDISFLNTLDCFHPAAKAHEQLAMGLWASMLCKDRTTACGRKFPEAAPYCTPRNATFYVPHAMADL